MQQNFKMMVKTNKPSKVLQAKRILVLMLVVLAFALSTNQANAQQNRFAGNVLNWPRQGGLPGLTPMKPAGYYVVGYHTRVVLVNDGFQANVGGGYGPLNAGVGYNRSRPVYRQVQIKVYQYWDGYNYRGQPVPDDQLPPNAYRMN